MASYLPKQSQLVSLGGMFSYQISGPCGPCLGLEIMIENGEGVVLLGADGIIEINILCDKVSHGFKPKLSLYCWWNSSLLDFEFFHAKGPVWFRSDEAVSPLYKYINCMYIYRQIDIGRPSFCSYQSCFTLLSSLTGTRTVPTPYNTHPPAHPPTCSHSPPKPRNQDSSVHKGLTRSRACDRLLERWVQPP